MPVMAIHLSLNSVFIALNTGIELQELCYATQIST